METRVVFNLVILTLLVFSKGAYGGFVEKGTE